MTLRSSVLVAMAVVGVAALLASFLIIGVRGNDLTEIARANCEAINELVEQQNDHADSGRRVVEGLIAEGQEDDETPPTEEEQADIEAYLDATFGHLAPRDC